MEPRHDQNRNLPRRFDKGRMRRIAGPECRRSSQTTLAGHWREQVVIGALVLCAALVLVTEPAAINETEENAILLAVLGDPWLIDRQRPVFVGRRTELPFLTPWARDLQATSVFGHVDTERSVEVSLTLFESARQRNTRSFNMVASTLPAGLKWRGFWSEPADGFVIVSRPGLSADGLKAVVAVETATRHGWTAYLEKHKGTWTLVARGFGYLAG
jgi:hypothetical protein